MTEPNRVPPDTSDDELERTLQAAWEARTPIGRLSPDERRVLLEAVADALEAEADRLVELGMSETHLTEQRLRGELARTAFQFRRYGDAIEDESLAEHDPADPAATPAPRPDLRLTTRPLGVVLNFAASNFPFAFSVAGTDTASALAAGCPVIVKAHPGHPILSQATFEVMERALRGAGAAPGTVGIVYGRDASIAALKDRRVAAATFTGSVAGGRALFDIAVSRPVPIPFYGELGSLNPVVVAPRAAADRGPEILRGFAATIIGSSGQLCTKPGLLFWPEQVPVAAELDPLLSGAEVHELLTPQLRDGFDSNVSKLLTAGAAPLAGHPGGAELGAGALHATAAAFIAEPDALLVECFGPASLVITYADEGELLEALGAVHGNLTASIFADEADAPLVRAALPTLEELAGRILWEQWPTGVAVTRAQFHGGPYPATTNPLHTSVGTHAIRRFLRPITFQNFPAEFLPEAVRN